MSIETFLLVLISFISLGFLFVGVNMFKTSLKENSRCRKETSGVVVDYWVHANVDFDDEGRDETIYYCPIIEYKVGGVTYMCDSLIQRDESNVPSKGTKVKILYDAKDPSHAVEGTKTLGRLGILIALLGAVIGTLGAIGYIMLRLSGAVIITV